MEADQTKNPGSWATYRWVLGHLRPYRMKMLWIILSGLAVAAGELVSPFMIQRLVDVVMPARDREGFFRILAVMAGIFVFILACSILRNSLQSRVSASAARDLQFSALRHLRKLGFAYYEQHPAGETLSLLTQKVQSAELIFRRYFPEIFQLTLFLLAAGAMLAYQSLLLSAIIVPCFLVYYLFGPKIDRKVSKSSREMSVNQTAFQQKAYETVSGAREFRAFGAEEWDIGRVRGKFHGFRDAILTWVFYIHFRWSLRNFMFQAGTVAIFIVGYFQIERGAMTSGEFISFLLVYGIFMFRLSWLVSQIIEQSMRLREVALLHEMTRIEPALTEPDDPEKPYTVRGALTFENVHFAYPGRPSVLMGFTLDIRAGERIAVVGSSGSGKSTLLKLVDRFYDPSEGRILLDGIPLPRLSFDDLRGSIGYVFQDTYLFGHSIRENIRFGNPEATDEEIVEAAKAAYAHPFIAELPEGYDTLVGERGVKLSGGQKQRIAIARMLVKNPNILLLDEATSALDNVSENAVRDALANLMAGRTTIAVAHRLSTVMDYDRIVVLDGGAVAEQGPYHELIAKRGLLYELAEGEARREESLDDPVLTGGAAVVLP